MADIPDDPAALARLDQARAPIDLLADELIHFDRRLSESFCETRRNEILDQWLLHRLGQGADD
jgi:hypothetical protein